MTNGVFPRPFLRVFRLVDYDFSWESKEPAPQEKQFTLKGLLRDGYTPEI